MAGLDVSSLKPVGAQQQEAAPAGKLDVSKLRPAYTPAPAAAPTEPQTSLIEDVGFGASRVGTAIPHLAEFALDVPQHIGAAAQWGVSGEMTGASADRPDIAQNFDTFATSKLGAPDFKAFPARGYDPAKLSGLYQEFLTQAPNAELHKRLTQGRLPEAYKAPLLGTDVFGGQLGAAAEGIKGITGGAVDLNKAFPEAKNKKQQAIEGTVEGIVTGGTSIPRSIARAALPQVFKKVGRVEADALRREVVTDMLTGGVGGYTGTIAAQNAPEGWELPASLVGGMAGGLSAVGATKAAGAVTDKVGGYLRPAITTKGNVERMTGEALRNAAADPNRAVDEMAAATAPEGVEFTTGQASQDIGLLNLEQTLARGKDQKFREAMVQRAREQNAALANAVRGIEQGASPSAMTSFFNDRMGQLNERLDQLDANARKLAQQEAAGLETPDAGDVGGNLQDALAGEMDRVKQEVAALDKAVDPTGTMRLPTGRLRTSAADIYADMSPEERLSITAEEKALLAVINGYGDTIPYQRFRDLRTQLNEDMRNARSAGKGRAYGRMSQMRGALEADIADAISGRFAREANAANEFVARARDWYERGAEAPARTGAAASSVGAAPGATPAVPPRAGEPGAAGREPGAPAGDTGLPEDAAARAAVEGRRRYDQKALAGMFRDVEPRALNGLTREQNRALSRATDAGDWVEADIPSDRLLATQEYVNDDFREAAARRAAEAPDGRERPMIVRVNGKNYVADGHHRVAAAIDRGDRTVPVRFVDLDQRVSGEVPDPRQGRLFQSASASNLGAETKPAFYSAALKSVEESKTNRASPQQWAATIKNTPGVKQEELDWLGLNSWLAQQKGAVTKEQVADFIRANQIEVEEVNLAGDGVDEFEADLPRRFDWEPDDVDEDFVREIAAERAVDEEDDYRERISNREDIDPGEVTEDQILQMAFEDEMRWRSQEPDGYHTSVTVETPDGSQTTYDIYRDSSGDTSIYNNDMGQVVDYERMDDDEVRGRIAQHLEESFEKPASDSDSDGPTQYENYTLPGGKDYHELLLKLPERVRTDEIRPSAEVHAKWKAQWDAINEELEQLHREVNTFPKTEPMSAERLARYQDLRKEQDALHNRMVIETERSQAPWKKGENFDAPHYDDQSRNILAHVRFKDRTSVDGKRTLFLEEVQSDWHQQGRDKGYKREPTAEETAAADVALERYNELYRQVNAERTKLWDAKRDARDGGNIEEFNRAAKAADDFELTPIVREMTQALQEYQRLNKADDGVPDAPFKTTWPELALKRMIRWAADNGYDQIAWTPGDVQNKRYGLSQQVDAIQWASRSKDGQPIKSVTIQTPRRGNINLRVDSDGVVYDAPSMYQFAGKPLAEVVGKDLAQQIMADADGEITKAGLAEIGGSGMREFYDRVLVSLGNKLGKKFGTQVGKTELAVPGDGRDLGIPRGQNLTASALPITDAMRAGAQQGFPLFQKANEAATSPLNDLPQPTEAQKEAGNYKKGRVRLGGLDISIENPAGSKRTGTDTAGKAWSVDMKDHYGYIRGTVGRDKDHLDTFVARDAGELTNDSPVFVVNQLDPKTRKFDEHKIMLGYPNRAAAEAAYKANYAKDWQGMGSIIPTNLGALKSWIADGNTKRPFKPGEIAPADATGKIADTMAKRFASAGRPEPEAKAAGQIVEAFYTTLANRLGVEADAVEKQFPLPRVSRGASADGFNQSESPKSAAFKRWFGASKVVDENGAPLRVFHGTTGNFDEFDPSRANPENDLGAGFYFSNTPDDVAANYAGEGPDLTNKLETTAERIADDLSNERGIEVSYEDPEVQALARRKLGVEHGGASMPVYLSIKKPVVLGGENPTYVRPKQVQRIVEELRHMDEEGEVYGLSPDDLVDDLDYATYEGIDAAELISKMKDSNAIMYAEDMDNGGMIANEVIRRVFEAIGFDGIIDHTVNTKFGSRRRIGQMMKGVNEGTTHYIAFRPEQIKSQFNTGSWSKSDPNIRKQGERGSILLGRDGAPALISLFETADATTALHESAHQFLDMFSRVAGGKGAPEGLLRDWNATKAWWQKNAKQLAEDAGEGITPADVRKALAGESLGAKKDAAVARGMHEQWARAFEVYLRDGKAPNAQMKGLFDQFKDWLTQVYQSITGMGIDLSPDIRGVFDRMLGAEGGDIIDRPAAKRLSDVTQRWKDYYGTYTDKAAGPVPAIVRKSKGESYPFDMPPEAVTKATWKPGPDGATAIRNILKAAGQDRAAAVKGIEQSAMLSLTRAALKDGVVDPAAFDKWKATHSDALAAMPELAKRLSNAADATRAMQKVAKQALDTRQAVERSAVGSILKLGADASDADISRKIGGMIGRQDAVKNMRELVNQARGEPEALAGLRRAVVDYALMQFTREENLSAAAMKRWVARNRPALETVLDPAQMQTLNAVVAASDRISNIVRAPGGGSPTAEYLMSLSKREKPSMLREMLSHAFANAVQSGLVGGVGHVLGGLGVGINTALGAFLSRAGIDALRARGFAKVHDLMLEAILDPELGRTLMMKAAKEKGKGSARALERTLASGLIGAIGGGREQARERAATGG